MTREEALDWIQQVDGRLYQNPKKTNEHDEWVAVIQTPPAIRRRGKVIIGIGNTLQQATTIAEQEWNDLFDELSGIH
ncbi:MAG: hypothetical protein JRG80_18850 [Deltaproteobacteria bacterium]|nr:hypothetical protein [Deltaproteobacteria bacterium]MBW2401286.1 hypothetical protein [Deltaproteobacteria bacterium]MBW2668191.1 hypothetical protein [Deltaproteobacteria bacterium]